MPTLTPEASSTAKGEGRFRSKYLKEFLSSFAAKLKFLPNHIEKIKLVLQLKIPDVDIEMEARSEDIWEMTIATFRHEIKRAKEKGEVEGVSVLVAPVMRKGDPELEDLEDMVKRWI